MGSGLRADLSLYRKCILLFFFFFLIVHKIRTFFITSSSKPRPHTYYLISAGSGKNNLICIIVRLYDLFMQYNIFYSLPLNNQFSRNIQFIRSIPLKIQEFKLKNSQLQSNNPPTQTKMLCSFRESIITLLFAKVQNLPFLWQMILNALTQF